MGMHPSSTLHHTAKQHVEKHLQLARLKPRRLWLSLFRFLVPFHLQVVQVGWFIICVKVNAQVFAAFWIRTEIGVIHGLLDGGPDLRSQSEQLVHQIQGDVVSGELEEVFAQTTFNILGQKQHLEVGEIIDFWPYLCCDRTTHFDHSKKLIDIVGALKQIVNNEVFDVT